MRPTGITPADVAAERARFPGMFAAPMPERLRGYATWGGAAALTVYCLYRFGFLSMDFVHGVAKFGVVVVAQLFPPTGWEQLPTFGKVIGETIAMAFLGTLMGAALAFPLSFFAFNRSRLLSRFRSAHLT